jgi:uncharacterized protein YfeS
MKKLREKYAEWMDEAMDLAEEDGLFIGAAFSQIAYNKRMKEEMEDLALRERNREIMSASVCETLYRRHLQGKLVLSRALDEIRDCLLAITKNRMQFRREINPALLNGKKYFELRTTYAKAI